MELFENGLSNVFVELQKISDSLQELKQDLYNSGKLCFIEHNEKIVIINDSFNNNSGTINFKV